MLEYVVLKGALVVSAECVHELVKAVKQLVKVHREVPEFKKAILEKFESIGVLLVCK